MQIFAKFYHIKTKFGFNLDFCVKGDHFSLDFQQWTAVWVGHLLCGLKKSWFTWLSWTFTSTKPSSKNIGKFDKKYCWPTVKFHHYCVKGQTFCLGCCDTSAKFGVNLKFIQSLETLSGTRHSSQSLRSREWALLLSKVVLKRVPVIFEIWGHFSWTDYCRDKFHLL